MSVREFCVAEKDVLEVEGTVASHTAACQKPNTCQCPSLNLVLSGFRDV